MTTYQYVFFRLGSEPHKPAYAAFDPKYIDGSPWTPDTSAIYKPFPNLDDEAPFGANPTAFYFDNSIYMLLRTNNLFGLTGKKVMLQNLYWDTFEVDLSITSEDAAVPVVTENHLHVFHQKQLGKLEWSRYDTRFDEEKKEPQKNTNHIVSINGFPSLSIAYRNDHKKYSGRLFYKTESGILASKKIDDFDEMAFSDKEDSYSNILLSDSPSAVSWGDDKGINSFFVFYQSKKDNYLMCAKFDNNGTFLSEHNLSNNNGISDTGVRVKSSPSTLIVGNKRYPRVFYIGTDRQVKRVMVDLHEMKIVSHGTVTTSLTPGGDVSPFSIIAPILVKDFSRSPRLPNKEV